MVGNINPSRKSGTPLENIFDCDIYSIKKVLL